MSRNEQVLGYIEDLQKCRSKFKNGQYGMINEDQFKNRMKERFSAFSEAYPILFEKSVDGFFEKEEEMERLRMAMGYIDRTRSGNLDKEEGEKMFGQHLVDTYVKPDLEKNKKKGKK